MKIIAFVAVLSLAGPASALANPAPSLVRVITDEAARKSCQYLGLVTVRKAMGPNKAGGALKKALAEVAKMGGNGLFLINQSETWVDGASASGEALKCPNASLP